MKKEYAELWKAPQGATVPDFIICGAMKCGTSTVHSILDQHPDVFIPKLEVNFFDMDDVLQHPDFFFYDEGKWCYPNFNKDKERLWESYGKFFEPATEGQLLGEDSTCYLPSVHAASRIAAQDKDVKTIICLRDPVERAFSQYSHMVRSGRAEYSFEDTIFYQPHFVLDRSLYHGQVANFLNHIKRENVFFFILEEFKQDKLGVTSDLLKFLGLDVETLPDNAFELHSNPAYSPKYLKLELWKNKLLSSLRKYRYVNHFSYSQDVNSEPPTLLAKLDEYHRKINPMVKGNSAVLKPETKAFLNDYFSSQFQGFDELVGRDITQHWFKS